MTSALPPALVIFSCADLENLCACTFTFFLSSPSPRTFTSAPSFASPALTSESSVTSASPSSAMRSRLRMVYSVRKILLKPRFGRRRCSGIWPPSKPRIMRDPERERWPLWPRPEVLPMPEPMPRPTRFLFELAAFGARSVERLVAITLFPFRAKTLALQNSLVDDLHEVGDLRHHAADARRVFAFDDLIEAGETQPFHHELMLLGRGDLGTHVLDANHLVR